MTKRTEELKIEVDAISRDRNGKTGANRLLALPVAMRVLLSVTLLACVAVLDIVTGSELGFSIFYLVPVSFAGALLSRKVGVVLAILSAATWGYLEFKTGRTFSAAWIPYWNSAVRLGFFLIVNEFIARLRQAYAKQRTLVREDPLTGIANVHVFEEHLHQTIALSGRSGRPFTVAYVDLDRFKHVNDEFGHSEGDRLLRAVALLLRDGVRRTDVVARLGGDKFGILMPDTELEQAQATFKRVAVAIAGWGGRPWAVGATIGAVTFTEPPGDVDCALREADALMDKGKAAGGGDVLQAAWPRELSGGLQSS